MSKLDEYRERAHAVMNRLPLYESVSLFAFGIPKHFIDWERHLSSRPDVLRYYVYTRPRDERPYTAVRWVRVETPMDFGKFIAAELTRRRKSVEWLARKAGLDAADVLAPPTTKHTQQLLRALDISVKEGIRMRLGEA